VTGLVIRVDRFGQVRLVPTHVFLPTLPITTADDDGVYDITTTEKETTS
jgi:hypothetical protein